MAKIRVDLDYPIYNGTTVTFSAPCDCTAVDGLTIYTPEETQTFSFCDAHGESLTGIGNVFVEGVPVKVILDVANSKAFVQNGDTNSYLDKVLAGFQTEQGSYVGTGTRGSNNPNSLTFGFVPKLVYVSVSGEGAGIFNFIAINGMSLINCRKHTADGDDYIRLSWNEKTLVWYSKGDADCQLNKSGTTYYYVAIG